MEKIILGKDECFLMGNNCRDLLDSRHVCTLSREDILGAAEYVIFLFNWIGALR